MTIRRTERIVQKCLKIFIADARKLILGMTVRLRPPNWNEIMGQLH